VDGSPQAGYAILLTTRDQGGAMPWDVVQDITITDNIVRKSNVGISLYGVEGSGEKRIKVANNLFDDIGLNWGNNDRSGLFTQFQTVGDTEFNHNTIINDGDIMFANGTEVADLDFNNNIVNHNAKRTTNFNRGINGVGTGIGVPTLDAEFVQYLVTKNVMANASGGTYTGSAAGNFFPGSSATPGDFSSVGFTSLANRDYRITSGPYNNAGTDGTDIGANIDTLESAVGGAMTMQITGTSGNDTYYVKRNGNLLEVYNNATGTGTPIQRDMFVYYESLIFDTGGGDDTITLDYSNGSPVPAGGVFVDGNASSSGDTLKVIGNAAAATYSPSGTVAGRAVLSAAGGVVTMLGMESVDLSNMSAVTLLTPNASDTLTVDIPAAGKNRVSGSSGGQALLPVTLSSSIPLTINAGANDAAGGSNDSITLNAASGSSIRFIGGGGNDAMTISGGALTFNSDLGADSSALALTVAGGAAATFAAPQHLRSLTVNGLATMPSTVVGGVLTTKSLTVAGGKLDLTDNTLVVDYSGMSPIGSWTGTAYDGITGLIQSGRNGGAWNGNGIVTSAASGNLTTLGVAEIAGDVVVKFTYGGDANLDGKINVDDYGRIDFNVNLGTSGWYNGDFNYDGKVNVDDYGIIDFNIGIQGPPLLSSVPSAGTGSAADPSVRALLSNPVASFGPAIRKRDVFDSIFSTADVL